MTPEEQYQSAMRRAIDSYRHAGATEHVEYGKAVEQLAEHNRKVGSDAARGI